MPATTIAGMSRLSAATLSASALLALGAASPAMASTASLSPDGQFLDIVETTPGEANDIRISVTHNAVGPQVIDLFDSAGNIDGAGCFPTGASIRCTDPVQQVRISTAGGDDRVSVDDAALSFGAGALAVDLGPGQDRYTAEEERGQAAVNGGPGNDDLRGGGLADVLDGGPGDDVVNGFEGTDSVQGGDGNDTVSGDTFSDKGVFADVVDGGPGVDTLDDFRFSGDAGRAPAITVSLDGQANDGRPGENDNVGGVEIIKSGSAGSFTGDDAANEFVAPQTGAAGTLLGLGGDDVLIAGDAHGDTVDGGAGNDTVEGGFGDDRLVGGPGRDVIAGDRKSRCNEMACDVLVAGNDTIEAREGEVDSISCGPGTDRVVADAADVVAADCETVERPGTSGTPPGGGTTTKPALSVRSVKLRTALRNGLKVTVTNARGKVTLKARRGKTTVATGKASAKGGKAVVTLRFTKRAKRALARTRKVTLTISGAGVSRKVTLKR